MRLNLLSRDFLNERLVPELEIDTVQYFDHIRRYLFAQQYVYGRSALDIACGTGYGGDILRRGGARVVIGVDLSAAALRYAAARWVPAHLVRADAAAIPFPAGAFDVIVSFETLEHLTRPTDFLRESRRVLRPGGYLILSTPNRKVVSPGSDTPHSPYHTFEPTRDELLTLLDQTGWSVLALRGITHSRRAQALMHPASNAPSPREPAQQVAWNAYLRLAVRAILPPFLYWWLARHRRVSPLELTDSVLTQDATDESTYFIALCTPK